MDFTIDQNNTAIPDASKTNQDDNLLEATFAKFGLDLNEEAAQIPSGPSPNADKTGKDGNTDPESTNKDGENTQDAISSFLQQVPLPDFNTKDHKVKRILDSVPDFGWLFA